MIQIKYLKKDCIKSSENIYFPTEVFICPQAIVNSLVKYKRCPFHLPAAETQIESQFLYWFLQWSWERVGLADIKHIHVTTTKTHKLCTLFFGKCVWHTLVYQVSFCSENVIILSDFILILYMSRIS